MKKHIVFIAATLLFCWVPAASAAEVIANRVAETTTTSGTGTYSLAGARSKYQTFVSGIGDGNTCRYVVWEETDLGGDGVVDWEIGLGTVTDADPDTLARTSVEASTNGGSAVDWATGTKYVHHVVTAALLNTFYQTIDTISLGGTSLQLSLSNDGEAAQTVDMAALSVEDFATAGGSGTGPVSDGASSLSMTDIATQAEQDALQTDDIWTLTGLTIGDTSFGTFTGTTLSDSETLKNLLQELETAVEGAGGGSAITFDIGDDGGNDSTDLSEIATTGDTNSIFTESSANKMLVNLSNNWPTADLASTLTITDTAGANENNALVFTPDGDTDGGDLGLESDSSLTYNPDTGYLTASEFSGGGGSLTGIELDQMSDLDGEGTAGVMLDDGDGSFSVGTDLSSLDLTIGPIELSGGADALSNEGYSGIIISGRNAGEAIDQGNLVYWHATDSEWHEADADAADHWPARGVALSTGSDGSALDVLVQGVVRHDDWAFGTVGATVFLSDDPSNNSGVTLTAPSTSGDCVQQVGFTLSDDEVYFNFSGHWLVVE
jgi:hypothetical protein